MPRRRQVEPTPVPTEVLGVGVIQNGPIAKRKEPGMAATVVGTLENGASVEVVAVNPSVFGTIWMQEKAGWWFAARMGKTEYVRPDKRLQEKMI